jgi:MFS family permease
MTESSDGWREMFSGGRGLAATVLMSGVALQAMETFIVSTLLPSVVGDIGGLELFAWNTTVFIVASIVAAIFAAVRPFGLGPRGSYILAAMGFALGSLICGLAPVMEVMLVGRAVQGFGAGLLTALSYAMIRLVFPQHLWGRGFALISSVWGVSTLIGPAVGGVFATFDAWRWAFLILVPAAGLLGLLALRAIPAKSDEQGMQSFPVLQIVLLIGAITGISVASVLTEGTLIAASLIVLSVLAVVVLGVIDRRSSTRLFPLGTFSAGSVLAPLFAVMLLINAAIISDMFVPLFLQQLHGQTPLIAGYMVALVAVGWSSGSMLTASWTGQRARAILALGPVLQTAGAIGLALFVARDNRAGELLPLLPIGLSLLLLGLGIGVSWPQVSSRLLQAAPQGERDLTSASISMVQLFAAGLGAAVAGVIVNGAGIAAKPGVSTTSTAALWLYGLFILVPVAAIPIAWRLVRTEGTAAVEVPAE